MDLRTIRGKEYKSLEDPNEKNLFLLETLINEVQLTRAQNYNHHQTDIHIKKLLELQTKCLVFLAQSQNTDTTACEKYREYLTVELKKITEQPFSWGGKRKW